MVVLGRRQVLEPLIHQVLAEDLLDGLVGHDSI